MRFFNWLFKLSPKELYFYGYRSSEFPDINYLSCKTTTFENAKSEALEYRRFLSRSGDFYCLVEDANNNVVWSENDRHNAPAR